MARLPLPVLASPLIRRVAWHIRRVGGSFDRRFFLTLAEGIVGFVLVAAIFITLFEKEWRIESVFDSFNWGIATVLGQGDSGFVTSPAGRIVGWLLILFGVAMLGMITGALVAMVIDFLLKEGQGLGASGFKDHIIVCGWNTTARDLIEELKGDDYDHKVVVLADYEKNPAGSSVYFVRGDATDAGGPRARRDRRRGGRLVFPADPSDEADMHSILTVMAIESHRSAVCGRSPRSTTRATSRTSDGPTSTSCWSRPRSPRTCSRARRCTPASRRSSPTSCPAARGPSCTGSPCPTTSPAWPSTRPRRGSGSSTTPRCSRSTGAAASYVNPAGPISGSRSATTRSSSPRVLGTLAPLKMRDATMPPQSASAVPSA